MIRIANPIYDVVFKYLMSDNKVAKLLLSTIIGEEIIELQFDPTETTLYVQGTITVLRMDFKATVQYKDGSKQLVIIELQKAKLHTDIMRFRRYLGKQYAAKENSIVRETYTTPEGTVYEKRDGLPIISIYFLGYPLEFAKDIPVIKVARKYIDVATGAEIHKKEKFIESLTHDSYVIQIPNIKGRRRTELEQLLYVFDQNNTEETKEAYKQFLTIQEESIPKRYLPVIRRLLKAFATPKVREEMDAEEEILAELQDYERVIESMRAEVEFRKAEIAKATAEIQAAKVQAEKAEAEVQATKVQVEKAEAEAEAAKVESEKQKAEAEAKDKTIEKAIVGMLQLNISVDKVAQIFNKSVDEIKAIKGKL